MRYPRCPRRKNKTASPLRACPSCDDVGMTPDVAPCGVLFSAFSSESFVRASALAAQHVALQRAPAGWCALDRALTRYPVVLATDVEGDVARAAVKEALSPLGARGRHARFEIQMLGSLDHPLGGIPAPFDGVRSTSSGNVAAWKWWRPALYMHSPFRLTLSLDTDALPCSASSISDSFAAFARLAAERPGLPLAAPQYIQHDSELARKPSHTLRTYGVLRDTPLQEAAAFTGEEAWAPGQGTSLERVHLNAGFVLFDREAAAGVFNKWAEYLAQAARHSTAYMVRVWLGCTDVGACSESNTSPAPLARHCRSARTSPRTKGISTPPSSSPRSPRATRPPPPPRCRHGTCAALRRRGRATRRAAAGSSTRRPTSERRRRPRTTRSSGGSGR